MKIEEARERIEYLQNYIKTIEDYVPKTMEQEAVYLYVQWEHVGKVTDELNRRGYRIGKRKLISNDVSDIIRTKPYDHMHSMAQKLFKKNKKRAIGKGLL